ncbi:MAG: tetratricopeptide repeat protein, partial [Verrucomicrobiota bacterium]
ETAVDPVTLVLFRSDRRLRPFKPMENGKPSLVAGFFVRVPARNTIAIAIEGARDDVREIIFHEAVHWHLTAAARPLPLWMEEGLAEVMGNFRLSGNSFVLGSPRPEFIRFIKIAKPVPVAQMLAVDGVQFNGKHGEQTQVFYCQAWALVHSLLFANGPNGHLLFSGFLATPPSDRGFLQDMNSALGVSEGDLERRLKEYLDQRKFNNRQYPFDRSSVEKGFVLTKAPAGAADLALGNLLVGSGRGTDAEPHFQRALVAMPQDARVHEGLASCSLVAGNLSAAREQFATAAQLPNATFLSHFMLAQLALTRKETFQFRLGKPDLSEPLAHLQRALKLNSRFQPAYENLGVIAMTVPGAPAKEVRELLEAGAQHFPESFRIRVSLAFVQSKAGDMAAARDSIRVARTLLPPGEPELQLELSKLEGTLGVGRP